MEASMINYPFFFGLAAAVLHVLSGPDHLAAVGPIALNSKNKSWMIGLLWGFGHIVGMAIIGILFIRFKDLIPVEKISSHSEQLVGIMLLAIGIWALWKLGKESFGSTHSHLHKHTDEKGTTILHQHPHTHQHTQPHRHQNLEKEKRSYPAVFGIGVIHGLAGVSHFLGILPTLAFETKWQSAQYLIGFSLGTIIAMVSFSLLLGLINKLTAEKKKFFISQLINGAAGLTAIFVGIFWLLHS